jgi:serine/threonine-protein kinase
MSDLAPNREIAGRYRTVRFIGKGGMGAVYEVEHLHTGQRLAMKVLSSRQPEVSVERFKREARAASRIQSDHVVRVTDADVAPELDGAPFLVMELLEGSDLEHATGDVPVPLATVVEWLRQIARALVKAHEAGIVHRDLKPENLFLTQREDGTPLVKILDFGIAKMAAETGSLTQSGQFLGTPYYMAPEQADSEGVVTGRADLYALGLITFRLLVGRSYWKPGSLPQLLAQILAEPMVPASTRGSTLGAPFDEWFQRACSRDPGLRYESAFEQVEALAGALGLPEQPRQQTPAAGTRPPPPMSVAITPAGGALKTLEAAPTLDASSRDMTTVRTRRKRRQRWLALAAAAAGALGIAAVVGQTGRPSPAPAVNEPVAATGSVVPAAVAPASAPVAEPVAAVSVTAVTNAADAAVAGPVHAPTPSVTPPRVAKPLAQHHGDASVVKDPLEGQY